MGKGDAPPPPDYMGLANQQMQANRPDTSTAFGSTQWAQGPNGQWSMQNSLNPQLQSALNGYQAQFAANAGKPLPTGQQARDQAINAAYGQATSRLDPQWAGRENAERTRLLNQGLSPTSQASQMSMNSLGMQRNDAYTSAMNAAIGQGAQAGNMIFQQGLQSQQVPMQALQGLFSLGGQPQFAQQNGLLSAAQMAGQYGMDAWRQQSQNTADIWGGAMDLAKSVGSGAAVAFSDERMKTHIVRTSHEILPGVPIATWEWKGRPGERHMGVIAQDLERVAPELVVTGEDGMKRVDYHGLLRKAGRYGD